MNDSKERTNKQTNNNDDDDNKLWVLLDFCVFSILKNEKKISFIYLRWILIHTTNKQQQTTNFRTIVFVLRYQYVI